MKISALWFFPLTVFAITATAADAFAPKPTSRSVAATRLHLYNSVQEAISEAQRICAQDPSSHECKVAWDVVEELEAADSHRGAQQLQQQQQQSGANTQEPDVAALMAGFDILIQKIDGKMDQLKATTVKFSEMGASDPSIEALYHRADEMKAALVNARNALPRY